MSNPFKSSFPIFRKYPDLIYLDNAATTQRPQTVIDALTTFYSEENASIHRGVYDLANRATQAYENARKVMARFFGAENPNTIAFTQGATEGINIVARSFVRPQLRKSDNLVISLMEHHANFLPWQQLAQETGCELRIIPVTTTSDLDYEQLDDLLDENTKMLAINHISNTLGTVNDIALVIKRAHQKGIPVLIDAAQSAAFQTPKFNKLDYDFLVCSGHKMFGPFGTGILFAAERHHKQLQPYNYGGGIIQEVKVDKTSYLAYPHNLDAGTPNIGGVIGLVAAIEFLESLDHQEVQQHLQELTNYAEQKLRAIDQIEMLGFPKNRSGIFSFSVQDIHPHDVATFLNKDQIAVRAGMHCTQPLLEFLGFPVTVRVSLALYNEKKDIDQLADSLKELINFWS